MSTAPAPHDIPESTGELDLDYLGAALRRVGQPPPRGPLRIEPLLGGRTGATVQRLTVGSASYVLKLVRERSWQIAGLGVAQGGEHRLWAAGVTRELTGPIRCPVIDVSREPSTDRYRVLMSDVSTGIRERGQFKRDDTRALFSALAAMQAPHFDGGARRRAHLPAVSGTTRLLRAAVLQLCGKLDSPAPWVLELVDEFKVVGAFLPLFLEVLGPRLADEYLALVADDSWVDTLDAEPATLLHGDLRRANISIGDGAIDLFDWEFAALGPAGCDLQWHCLLHYWGYPPDGTAPGDHCDDLATWYVDQLGLQSTAPVDREAFERGWQLGWLRAVALLGYTLVDPLYPDGGDEETRGRITTLCRRAVQRALDMRASLT